MVRFSTCAASRMLEVASEITTAVRSGSATPAADLPVVVVVRRMSPASSRLMPAAARVAPESRTNRMMPNIENSAAPNP
jgi:hypothetical protein